MTRTMKGNNVMLAICKHAEETGLRPAEWVLSPADFADVVYESAQISAQLGHGLERGAELHCWTPWGRVRVAPGDM